MRSVVRMSMFVLLLLNAFPIFSVRAEGVTHNDPHGRWSLILPDAYLDETPSSEQNTGSPITVTFVAPGDHNVIVSYILGYDLNTNLETIAQGDIDASRDAYKSFRVSADGIQWVMLGGQPAVQFDSATEDNGGRGREILSFNGDTLYRISILIPDGTFDELANEINAIRDSFRFFNRSIVGGVFRDPGQRFTFTVPPGYDMAPNPPENQTYPSSIATLMPTAREDADTEIVVLSFQDTATFEDRYANYATDGLAHIANLPRTRSGKDGIQRITLDGRPAGMFDFYRGSDSGVYLHTVEVFTVDGKTQYLLSFVVPDNALTSTIDIANYVLTSFHFLTTG